jgi:hypothetical protein
MSLIARTGKYPLSQGGALLALCAFGLLGGCGGSTPTRPDSLPPFVQWSSPAPSPAVFELPLDTVTVQFSAADDGGTISNVKVYLQGSLIATLTTAPYRTTLDLAALGHNRPSRVYASATDPTGKVGYTADTLSFMVRPVDTVTWTRLIPGLSPAPRVGHTFSLDAARDRALLFGGESFTSLETVNDTWSFLFATNTWDSLAATSPPLVRKDHMAGVVGQTLVVFGGELIRGIDDSLLQDYALLDLNSLAWAANLFSPFLDPLRSAAPAVMGSRVYAYGGSRILAGTADDSTLRYGDLFDTSWSEVSSYTNGPRVRVDAVMVADLEGGRLFVYGGTASPTDLPTNTSNFRFNLSTAAWASDPTRPGDPPALARAAAVYDSLNNRMLMWGGIDGAGGFPTDVWEYSLGSLRWRKLATSGSPPAGRTEHEMVIDAARSRTIMFGGRVSGVGVAETWEMRW